jgi:hypothetical protein
MDKLNLTKEQVSKEWGSKQSLPFASKDRCNRSELLQDWLTMHSELTRLHTAIEGARETINNFYEEAVSDVPTDDDYWIGKQTAFRESLDILNKHLGEEGKK